jgi:hypothetical protein
LLVEKLLASHLLVSPGGDLLITGDGNLLNAHTMRDWFYDRLYFRNIGDRLLELFQIYSSAKFYDFDGATLLKYFGIDSGWIAPDPSAVSPDERFTDDSFHPGVLLYMGKKHNQI